MQCRNSNFISQSSTCDTISWQFRPHVSGPMYLNCDNQKGRSDYRKAVAQQKESAESMTFYGKQATGLRGDVGLYDEVCGAWADTLKMINIVYIIFFVHFIPSISSSRVPFLCKRPAGASSCTEYEAAYPIPSAGRRRRGPGSSSVNADAELTQAPTFCCSTSVPVERLPTLRSYRFKMMQLSIGNWVDYASASTRMRRMG